MMINFRFMFVVSFVFTLVITLPICIYLLRRRSWSRWSTLVVSVATTLASFSALYYVVAHFEILELHDSAFLLFFAPLALVSSALAFITTKYLVK